MSGRAGRRSGKWLVWILVVLGVLVFVGANAHLIYVAFQSQPDCVDQAKDGGSGYRAARPSC